jgi:hypothetical protein
MRTRQFFTTDLAQYHKIALAFVQYILRKVNCPRCNAIAQERLEDRENAVVIYLWCEKCRLKRNLGITTRKALKLKKRQTKLRELADQEKNRRTKAFILRRVVELESEIKKAELGY